MWCETTDPQGWGWLGSEGCQEHGQGHPHWGLRWVPGQGLLLWLLSPRLDPQGLQAGAVTVPAVSPTVVAVPQP